MRRIRQRAIRPKKSGGIEERIGSACSASGQIHVCSHADVAEQANLHSRRNGQAGEKTLIEPLAADEAHSAGNDGTNGEEAQGGGAVGEVFTLQKCVRSPRSRPRIRDSRSALATARS